MATKLKTITAPKNSTANLIVESLPGGSFTGWNIVGNNKNIGIGVDINAPAGSLNNRIQVGSGAQTLIGGNGDDTLIGNGKSGLLGQDGDDLFVVSRAGDTIVGGGGVDTIQTSISYNLSAANVDGVENLVLTGRNRINGTGTNVENVIIGNRASNQLNGNGGADTINGGGGNDNITVAGVEGFGTASLVGGSGNDTFNVQGADLGSLIISGGTGRDVVNIAGTIDDLVNVNLANWSGVETVKMGNLTWDWNTFSIQVNDEILEQAALNSLSTSTSTTVDSLSTSTSTTVDSLSTSTSSVVDSLSTSTSTTVDSLSTSTSIAREYEKINAVYDQAGAAEKTLSTLSPLIGPEFVPPVGVMVIGGAAAIINPADTRNLIAPIFGSPTLSAEASTYGNGRLYGNSDTLWGYSPDPDYIMAVTSPLTGSVATLAPVNTTLNGGQAVFKNGDFESGWYAAGGVRNDSLIGNTLGDTLLGDIAAFNIGGSDTIIGDGVLLSDPSNTTLGGNDSIVGGYGSDSILAGAGNDTIVGDVLNYSPFESLSGNDTINAGYGNDSVDAGSGDDIVYGDDGSPLEATLAADVIFGGAGNDTIYGDSEGGAQGDDTISGGSGADHIYGGDGNNSIVGGSNITALPPFPDDEADNITAGSGNDTIYGGLGNDTIAAGGGNNSLEGQDGNDFITAETGNDTINGGDGADTIAAGGADNYVIGGANSGSDGADSITAGSGNDTIYGGLGNDTINGGGGNDSLLGEKGDDLFLFADSAAFIAATLNGGDDTDTATLTGDAQTLVAADFENASNIEILRTANGANSITLGEKAATLTGLDSVIGGTGSDTLVLEQDFTTAVSLYGGEGNDSVGVDNYGQVTLGYFDGGAGTDTLSISDSLGSPLSPSVISDANVVNFEALYLSNSDANYVQLGSATSPVTWGIASVFGGESVTNSINASFISNDINLYGGTSGDALVAGSGNDSLQGWSGSPSVNKSSDTLTGGGGDDTLIAGNSVGNAYGSDLNATLFAYGFEAGVGNDQIQVNGALVDYTLTNVSGAFYNLENTLSGGVIANLQITSGFVSESDFLTNNVIYSGLAG